MRLTNLSLKREACYSLGLPLDVLSGYVQSIELSIPWSRLGSEPVMLNLDGVYLVVGPHTQQGIDEHGQHTWSWARKRARIEREWRGAQLRRMCWPGTSALARPQLRLAKCRPNSL